MFRQIELQQFGPPDQVVRCIECADLGPPNAWEVVVDVFAFPINVADLAMMAGRYGTLPKPPCPIGMEAAGTIVACGASVKDFSVGDKVVLLGNYNWAQRRKLPVAAVHKLPAPIDLEQASMLKVNPMTAHCLLNDFVEWKPNDWVLLNAPASGAGKSILQMAKNMGLRTIGVVRRAEAVAEVAASGCDVVLEQGADLASRLRAKVREPIKLALDAVAGPGVQQLAECLCDNGKIINYGMLSNEPCSLHPEQTIFRGITLHGFWLAKTLNRLSLAQRKQMFDLLALMMLEGRLQLPIAAKFPITEIQQAIQFAERNRLPGKVLVHCQV